MAKQRSSSRSRPREEEVLSPAAAAAAATDCDHGATVVANKLNSKGSSTYTEDDDLGGKKKKKSRKKLRMSLSFKSGKKGRRDSTSPPEVGTPTTTTPTNGHYPSGYDTVGDSEVSSSSSSSGRSMAENDDGAGYRRPAGNTDNNNKSKDIDDDCNIKNNTNINIIDDDDDDEIRSRSSNNNNSNVVPSSSWYAEDANTMVSMYSTSDDDSEDSLDHPEDPSATKSNHHGYGEEHPDNLVDNPQKNVASIAATSDTANQAVAEVGTHNNNNKGKKKKKKSLKLGRRSSLTGFMKRANTSSTTKKHEKGMRRTQSYEAPRTNNSLLHAATPTTTPSLEAAAVGRTTLATSSSSPDLHQVQVNPIHRGSQQESLDASALFDSKRIIRKIGRRSSLSSFRSSNKSNSNSNQDDDDDRMGMSSVMGKSLRRSKSDAAPPTKSLLTVAGTAVVGVGVKTGQATIGAANKVGKTVIGGGTAAVNIGVKGGQAVAGVGAKAGQATIAATSKVGKTVIDGGAAVVTIGVKGGQAVAGAGAKAGQATIGAASMVGKTVIDGGSAAVNIGVKGGQAVAGAGAKATIGAANMVGKTVMDGGTAVVNIGVKGSQVVAGAGAKAGQATIGAASMVGKTVIDGGTAAVTIGVKGGQAVAGVGAKAGQATIGAASMVGKTVIDSGTAAVNIGKKGGQAVAGAGAKVGSAMVGASTKAVGGGGKMVSKGMERMYSLGRMGVGMSSSRRLGKKSKWEEGIEVIDEILDPLGPAYSHITEEQRMKLASVKKFLLKGPGNGDDLKRQHIPQDLLQIQGDRAMFDEDGNPVANAKLKNGRRCNANFLLQEYAGIGDAVSDVNDDVSEIDSEVDESEERDQLTGLRQSNHTLSSLDGPQDVAKEDDDDDASISLFSHATAHTARRMFVIDKQYIPAEFSYLDLSEQVELCQMLSWESLMSWDFDIFRLKEITNGQPLLFMSWAIVSAPYAQQAMAKELNQSTEADDSCGYGFMEAFSIPAHKLCNYMRTIEGDYNDNPYHNAMHAADIMQTTHTMIQKARGEEFMQDVSQLKLFAVLLAAAVHDVQHQGKTNAYHVKLRTELAVNYNDNSVLENHHAAQAFARMLNLDLKAADNLFDSQSIRKRRSFITDENNDNNILCNVTSAQFEAIRKLTIDAVLHTDMTKHFAMVNEVRGMLLEEVEEGKKEERSWRILTFMLHMCDISGQAKGGNLFKQWGERCMEEFFLQGDEEKGLGMSVSPNCDRETVVIAESQVGFMQFVVEPSYEVLGKHVSFVEETVLPIIRNNLDHWCAEQEGISVEELRLRMQAAEEESSAVDQVEEVSNETAVEAEEPELPDQVEEVSVTNSNETAVEAEELQPSVQESDFAAKQAPFKSVSVEC